MKEKKSCLPIQRGVSLAEMGKKEKNDEEIDEKETNLI